MKQFDNLSEFRNLPHISLLGCTFIIGFIKGETFLLLIEKCDGISGTSETGGHSDSEKCSRKQNR